MELGGLGLAVLYTKGTLGEGALSGTSQGEEVEGVCSGCQGLSPSPPEPRLQAALSPGMWPTQRKGLSGRNVVGKFQTHRRAPITPDRLCPLRMAGQMPGPGPGSVTQRAKPLQRGQRKPLQSLPCMPLVAKFSPLCFSPLLV